MSVRGLSPYQMDTGAGRALPTASMELRVLNDVGTNINDFLGFGMLKKDSSLRVRHPPNIEAGDPGRAGQVHLLHIPQTEAVAANDACDVPVQIAATKELVP